MCHIHITPCDACQVQGTLSANPSLPSQIRNYLLCKGSDYRTLRTTCLRVRPFAFLHHSRVEPFLDQTQDARVGNAMLHELDHPTFVEVVEKPSDVGIKNVVHLLLQERVRQRIQRLMLAAPRANHQQCAPTKIRLSTLLFY